LISVSVAPVSYFFCALAADIDSAIASAVPVGEMEKPVPHNAAFLIDVIVPMVLSGA